MVFYIARRLAWTVAVVLVVLAITFAVFYLLPAGDPAVRFAGKAPSSTDGCTPSMMTRALPSSGTT